jgi:hypothetical protein
VGRVLCIYAVNAPLVDTGLVGDHETVCRARDAARKKLTFVADDPAEKERLLRPTVDLRQAPSWLRPEGQLPHGGPIGLAR